MNFDQLARKYQLAIGKLQLARIADIRTSLLIANLPLSIAYCLLLIVYCLLLIVYCLLSIAY
jgi:hypothetical protein